MKSPWSPCSIQAAAHQFPQVQVSSSNDRFKGWAVYLAVIENTNFQYSHSLKRRW